MKIFEVLKNDQNQIDHLFMIQKARCYEYAVAARRISPNFVSDQPEPFVWLDLRNLSVGGATLNHIFKKYPNLRKKWDRMIESKQKYEEAGGKYGL